MLSVEGVKKWGACETQEGEAASFHDMACAKLYGQAPRRLYCESFNEVFQRIAAGETDFGLCAIENSLYGSINEVYDLLAQHKRHIVGETYLRIEQCLIGLPGASLSTIKKKSTRTRSP